MSDLTFGLPLWAIVLIVFFVAFFLGRWSARDGRERIMHPPGTPMVQQANPYRPSGARGAGIDAGSGSGLDAAFETEVRSLLSLGRKIEAIKLVRERTGIGLKEAKDLVENLE